MVIKIFKVVWLFSLLATMGAFFYTYASLPETIQLDESGALTISRNGLFYSVLGLLALFNALISIISRLYAKSDSFFRAWFYGLVSFLNLFVIITIQFLNVYNSAEKYDYASIGYIIYGSIGLMIIWAIAWPLFFIFQKSVKV